MWIGLCSTSFNNWFFTPEGRRIPIDLEPDYWELQSAIWERLSKYESDPEVARRNKLMAALMRVQRAQVSGSKDEESLGELMNELKHPDVKVLCSAKLGLAATIHLGLHWPTIRDQIRALDSESGAIAAGDVC